MVISRPIQQADAKACASIYQPAVDNCATSFEYSIPTTKDFEKRITAHPKSLPWLVCEYNGEVAGYAYASPFRKRQAYQWCCEVSVYVGQHYHRKGIGKGLYEDLFNELRKRNYINAYAGITLPNDASVAIHKSCGFEYIGTYKNIGYKLGRWHDVSWWHLQLQEATQTPEPPIKESLATA